MRHFRRVTLVLALPLALPCPAAAAESAARAEELFQSARLLLEAGNYNEACPAFEASQRAEPAPGTLLALAYCQEAAGLLASSWSSYLRAAELAARESDSKREAVANERAKALAARVSTLTIVVPSELGSQPELSVLRDGVRIERVWYGVPIALDGGTHVVEVVLPAHKRWLESVTLRAEGDHKTLTLPKLAAEPAIAREPADSAPTKRERIAAGAAAPPRLSPLAIALAVGSGVGLGFGTTFGLIAKSRNDASNEDNHCDATGCDAEGFKRRNSALSAAAISTWSFVAAGALAAGSVVLYFTDGTASDTRLSASVRPGAAGLTLSKEF
ncbi:MAG TPA: hypothetical protein VER33_24755 [Polyangiaceae bacterium]|nr:hypothetical protein [Polyangiaceae bacterium]